MSTDFTWAHALRDSPIFLILVGCSIVTLAVVCERLWYFWKRRGDADGLLQELRGAVRSGQRDRAEMICRTNPHPFSAVAARLIANPTSSEASSDEHIQVALSEQKMLFEKNLGIMATMAAVAPLIGLLGTVVGIMRAFGNMAKVGSASPSVVAAGVAEALVTTAAGLVVAVPAVILYNHLSRRMNNTLTVSENHARSLRTEMREAGLVAGDAPARGSSLGQPERASSGAASSDRTPASVG